MPHFSLHSSLLLSSLNLFDSSFFHLRSSLSSVNVYVIFSPEKCTGYLGKGYICNVNKIYSGKQKIKLAKTETVRKPISRNKTTYKTNLMNKLFTKLIIGISATASLSAAAETVKWNFTSVPAADQTAIAADTENWGKDSNNNRYLYLKALDNAPALAGGKELECIGGLRFTVVAASSGNLRLGDKSDCRMWIAGASKIIIPERKQGEMVQVMYATSSNGTARTFTAENVTESNFPESSANKTKITGTATVAADGDVTLTTTGALYIYSIVAGNPEDIEQGGGTTGDDKPTENPDNPTDTERGMSYGDPMVIKTPKAGEEDIIWCAPNGDDATADGSEANPYFDLQLAVNKAVPGTTIKMKSGTYVYDKRINIDGRNGTHDNYITVMCPDGRAVLDFSGQPYHAHSNNPYQGVRLTSSYWHFYKIDITNASDNGMLIERNKPEGGSAADILARTQDGHDNIIEFCHFYRNGDTGLQIKNLGAFNYILNCDAYENKDEGDGDADGFAPKVSVGDGNYFFGCRAYHNSDDGYDSFFKKDGGFPDNVTIVYENCVAYANGFINGVKTSGNMNGFKMGSNQGRMNVVLNRCVAVNNGSKSFDQNHNSGDIIMNNCTGYAQHKSVIGAPKDTYSYNIYEALASGSVCELTNCISISDYTDKSLSSKNEYGSKDKVFGRCCTSAASKETNCDYLVSLSNFVGMDHTQLIAERKEDGSLPDIDFAHPLEGNAVLVDKGAKVEANSRYASTGVVVPAIAFAGEAPDLGAYELGMAQKNVDFGTADGIGFINGTESDGKKVRLVQAFNGMVVLSVEGAKASDKYTVSAYTISGALLGSHAFNGTNTSVYLPKADGILLLKVAGKGVNETVKVAMK